MRAGENFSPGFFVNSSQPSLQLSNDVCDVFITHIFARREYVGVERTFFSKFRESANAEISEPKLSCSKSSANRL